MKFKKVDYENRPNEPFVLEAKKLLQFKDSNLIGSYAKWGKEKACDMDLNERLYIEKNEIKDIFNEYFTRLKKENLIITSLTLNIIDESIQNILKQMGYLDGLFNIHNYNINKNEIKLNSKLKKKIIGLIDKYEKTNNLDDYLKLYVFLKSKLQPYLSIDEILKDEYKLNDKKIKISDGNFSYMYIEIIYQNFKISHMVSFPNLVKIYSPDSKIIKFDLDECLEDSKLNYYKILKKFFHWLKKCYFNNILKNDNTILLFNQIFDYRESIGEINNNICKLKNILFIKKDIEIQKNYDYLNNKFNVQCKEYYENVSKPYKEYLAKYLILQ